MKKNVGSLDRVARGLGASGMIVAALVAPWELWLRIGVGATGAYVLLTAFVGTCVGYRLVGLSTCPLESK
jgi:hypothetical protein